MIRNLPRRSYRPLAFASLSGGSVYCVVWVAGVAWAAAGDAAGAAACAITFCGTKAKQKTSRRREPSNFMKAASLKCEVSGKIADYPHLLKHRREEEAED